MRNFVDVVKVLLLVCAFDSVTASSEAGQSESGGAAVTGVVRDEAGEAVPGVAVTARHAETGAVRTAVTDAAGRFTLAAMAVGPYTLDAALTGFATARHEQVVLSVGRTVSLGIVLRVGGV